MVPLYTAATTASAGRAGEMPPKSKAKSQQKKKVKKPKAGPGSVEEQFRKATLEVDILQDHLGKSPWTPQLSRFLHHLPIC
ncbi:hypothetical protein GDO78_011320 [Eleutherodactylus coqui]|uniref:Uncharacterized protein n=1 Tax=Eleutherodactylus coqui TaxID=57060 RepID=A0A8J6F8N8_ELECQ|nr:hypothetical protein GDO78_011320 [Eleutherodactylus coqui]